MKSEEIKKQIEKLEKDYLEAKAKEKQSLYTKEEMEVATLFHESTCTSNHTDACDWYYDNGDWTAYSRVKAMKKAKHLLSSFSFIDIKAFFEISKEI